MNRAVLETVMQATLSGGHNVVSMSQKPYVGRHKIEFPKQWDELYEKWENKEISSNDFIDITGLKRATFYNLVTEYRTLKELNEEYIKRIRHA